MTTSVRIVRMDTKFGSKVFSTKETNATYCYRAARAVGTVGESLTGILLLLAGSMDNVTFTTLKTIQGRDGHSAKALVMKANAELGAKEFNPDPEVVKDVREIADGKRKPTPKALLPEYEYTPRIRYGQRVVEHTRAQANQAIAEARTYSIWGRIFAFFGFGRKG